MASTPLLGLSLPADGTTNWGTLVNTSITALIDSAVAGTTTLSTDTDVTLSITAEAANQARQMIILCTGARAGMNTITAPAQSKIYLVINATTGSQAVKIVGDGPTTGVTIPAGSAEIVAWNGSDFVKAYSDYVTTSTAQTLTNKDIVKRVVTIASASSITPNANTTDILVQANTESVGTLTINAPTGSPVNGQSLVIRLSSTSVQTFSWNAIYQGSTDLALPTATSSSSKFDYLGFIYNSSTTKWQLLAKNFGF